MPRIRLRNSGVPVALSGWLLIDSCGLPRYWPSVWVSLDGANLEQTTLGAHLLAIEQFYSSVERQLGVDCLDSLITSLDFDQIEQCLESFFVGLNNRSAQHGGDFSVTWRRVLNFVKNCLERLTRSGSHALQIDQLQIRLVRLERLYRSLNLPKKRKPDIARALPASVIEELYGLISPTSTRNPFRTNALRWRNFVLILMLLHQGLRRSEALVLPADALKEHSDSVGGIRYWLDVYVNPYEISDQRSDSPTLKNANAQRQIPVAESIASAIETYVINYRTKPRHSFLFSSQGGAPLSKRSVNQVLETVSRNLSPAAKKELRDRKKSERIHPHALRHTCAVVRLKQLIDSGVEMELALQKLRVFFGWSTTSNMPSLYARAYFEDRLATVWQDSFDLHVKALRELA